MYWRAKSCPRYPWDVLASPKRMQAWWPIWPVKKPPLSRERISRSTADNTCTDTSAAVARAPQSLTPEGLHPEAEHPRQIRMAALGTDGVPGAVRKQYVMLVGRIG